MATPSAVGSFPSPYEVETPPGCEGWEEMYPVLRALRRGAARGGRAALLVLELDALPGADARVRRDLHRHRLPGARLVAEPRLRRPAGDGHRLALHQRLHLHLRQPGHSTRRRSPSAPGYFQQRAGYYYENWNELYAKWRTKMEALIAELERAARPGARRVRAGRGRVRGPGDELLRRARRLPQRAAPPRRDVAAPLRVPAARLRRVHDLRRAVQGQPAGHPRPAHRADGRGPRRAPLPARRRASPARAPRDRHRRRRGVRRGPLAGGDRRGARAERRRPRLARGARVGEGAVVPHGHGRRPLPHVRRAGSTTRRSRTPR